MDYLLSEHTLPSASSTRCWANSRSYAARECSLLRERFYAGGNTSSAYCFCSVEAHCLGNPAGLEFRVQPELLSAPARWPSVAGRRFALLCLMAMFLSANTSFGAETLSLAERLGYKASDKLLIINGDDAGMCHSANQAVIQSMQQGLLTSATIMVPCAWFPEIAAFAKENPNRGFGVHLCHTAEWKKYRWDTVAPRAEVPGLLDPDGYMWRGVMDVYSHATPEEAVIEGRAQVKRALASGVDVTHLDSHMGTLQLHPEFVKAYLRLGVEFSLPLRMASQDTLARRGFPELRQQFAAKGIVFTDDFIYEELSEESKDVKGFWMKIVKNLKPGVTELYIHPTLATDESRAITGTWATRMQEFEAFTTDQDIKKLIADEQIKLISYRPLRDLQRRESR